MKTTDPQPPSNFEEGILHHYELAARLYCEKARRDPDERLISPGELSMIAGQYKRRARWQFVAVELHDMSIRLLALKEAAAQKQEASDGHSH